jgi:hypothetical protein
MIYHRMERNSLHDINISTNFNWTKVPKRKQILSSCPIPEFLADLVDERGDGRGRGL